MHCHISGYLLQVSINVTVHTEFYLVLCEQETKGKFTSIIIPMKINYGNYVTRYFKALHDGHECNVATGICGML